MVAGRDALPSAAKYAESDYRLAKAAHCNGSRIVTIVSNRTKLRDTSVFAAAWRATSLMPLCAQQHNAVLDGQPGQRTVRPFVAYCSVGGGLVIISHRASCDALDTRQCHASGLVLLSQQLQLDLARSKPSE